MEITSFFSEQNQNIKLWNRLNSMEIRVCVKYTFSSLLLWNRLNSMEIPFQEWEHIGACQGFEID